MSKIQNIKDKDNEEIFSKIVRAGRRTYFFDVRSTKADDYYITITESKKYTNEDGSFRFKKHKLFLYKEDFEEFRNALEETTDYVLENRGEEVISDKHQTALSTETEFEEIKSSNVEDFTSVEFEDL
jgi:hypothetical protein